MAVHSKEIGLLIKLP